MLLACGITENDDIKLRKFTACHLVRYCSVECQKEHRKKHKKECRKRAAELREELLFKQPENNYLGDCPICCIPLPIDQKNVSLCRVAPKPFVMGALMPIGNERLTRGSRVHVRFVGIPLQNRGQNILGI